MKFIAPITHELIDPMKVIGDSPRLAWIKRHKLTLLPLKDGTWECVTSSGPGFIGATADDALFAWAKANKQLMWNEV